MASDATTDTQNQPFLAVSHHVDSFEHQAQQEVPRSAPSCQNYAPFSPDSYYVSEGQVYAFTQEHRPTAPGQASVYWEPANLVPAQTAFAHAQEQEIGQGYAPSQQYAVGIEQGAGFANGQQEDKTGFQQHGYEWHYANQHTYVHSPDATPPTKWKPFLAYRIWAWEVAASLLSIACVACVAGILAYEQGRPLDQWQRGLGRSISPTAVVSFLGTIGKSACLLAVAEIISQLKWIHFRSRHRNLADLQLFDEASRGPWGALRLAVAKNRSALLAVSASVLVVAAVFVDPFIQLVFSFPSILTPVTNATVSIAASQVYDPIARVAQWGWCTGSPEVDPVMQAAILSPLLNSSRSPDLSCSFERCDWPAITTLGVCSSCLDLLDTVIPSCAVETPPGQQEQIQCNYTLPTTNTTFSTVFAVTGGALRRTAYQPLWSSTISDTTYSEYVPAESKAPELTRFSFISFAPDIPWQSYIDYNSGSFALRSFPSVKQAMQCSFNLCARSFTAPSYVNSTAGPLTGSQTPLVVTKVPQVDASVPVLVNLAPSTSNHPPMNTTFQINYCDYMDLAWYFGGVFTTQATTLGGSAIPDMALSLSKFYDISALMQDVADSMTETIRTSANSTAHTGIGSNSVTYISITWVWLLLPVALVLFTFVMLIVVMLRNNARGVPAWKSSSLALLFHDLEGWDKSGLQIKGPGEIKAQAATMTARVSDQDSAPSFLRADCHGNTNLATE